jgi:hypothetical protein
MLLKCHIGHFVLALLYVGVGCASAGSLDTTLAEPHPNSNIQQSKNETANVVVQQHTGKLLKIGILMPETC